MNTQRNSKFPNMTAIFGKSIPFPKSPPREIEIARRAQSSVQAIIDGIRGEHKLDLAEVMVTEFFGFPAQTGKLFYIMDRAQVPQHQGLYDPKAIPMLEELKTEFTPENARLHLA